MNQLFKHFDLNKKEVESFLKLLELDAQPISVLAKHMGIPRSSMYTIVDKLLSAQIIESFERKGIRYVKCIPVADLEMVLKAKQKKLEQGIEVLHKKLPELEALENQYSYTPRVKYFEGHDGIVKMYEEVLKEDGFSTYFDPELVKQHMPHYHYEIGNTIKQRKLNVREILKEGPAVKEYRKLYESKLHQIKVLAEDSPLPSDIIICKDKIYMISYGEKDMVGIVIVNHSLAKSQQTIFDELWAKK